MDAHKLKEEIVAALGDRAQFASSILNLPRASKLIELAETMPLPTIEQTHSFVPKYHRLAQAEAEWLKEQKKEK